MKILKEIPNYRQIYELAGQIPGIRSQTRERILSFIDSNTRKKEKPSITKFFRYSFSLKAAAIIVLLLASATTLFLLKTTSAKTQGSPMIVISNEAGTVNNSEDLFFGYKIRKSDILNSGNEQISIQRGDTVGIQLFENTSFKMASHADKSETLHMVLGKGSMYINKEGVLERDKNAVIDIMDYAFVLVGTRVFLSLSDENVITVICYDGKVQITRISDESENPIGILFENEKVVISEKDGMVFSGLEGIDPAEKAIDNGLRSFIPFKKTFSLPDSVEHIKTQNDLDVRIEGPAPANTNQKIPETSGLTVHTDKKSDKPDYSVNRIGIFPGYKQPDNGISFFSNTVIDETAYILSDNTLAVFRDNNIEAIDILPDNLHFRVKPVGSEEYLGLASTDRIFLIDRKSLSVISEYVIPGPGTLSDNYLPLFGNEELIIPVLNKGYYRLDLAEKTDNLEIIQEEVFPVSPVITGDGLIIGSFYDNYIKHLNSKRETDWNIRLEGSSFANFLAEEDSIFIYILENNKPYILEYESGKLKQRWSLDNPIVSDFGKYNEYIYGINVKGILYILNTDTGSTNEIVQLYSDQLTTRTFRNLLPYVYKGRIAAGSDTGELLFYDPEKDELEKILIDRTEKFYSNPFAAGNRINIVSNSGVLYSVAINDR